MKVLLIGGTGFIGSNIVEELLINNYEVSVLTRGKSNSLISDENSVEKIIGDRHDAEVMKSMADRKFDAVIDMTAFVDADSKQMVECFMGKTERFIHTSTVSVYMISHDVRCPITEDQDKGEVMDFWPMNPFGMQYGIDKRGCEKILWTAYEEKGFPVTMVRPPYVCGPNDPMKRDYFWIERILDNKPLLIPGAGDYASQNVYVKDLAKSYVELLKNEKTIGQAYNVASKEVNSLNDYLDKLSALLDKQPERVSVDIDLFLQQTFAASSDGHAFPFNTYTTAVFSLDKIKRDTNFISTPFEDWMPETIEWYLNDCVGHSVGYSNRNLEIEFISRYKDALSSFRNAVIKK